jgi:hypothetical protein
MLGTNARTTVDWRGAGLMTLVSACASGSAFLLALSQLVSAGGGRVVKEDFSGKAPGKAWKASPEAWKVEAGELQGKGPGHVELVDPIAGDFALTFKARTAEKANIEVKLLDEKGETTLYTFAFLGRYHSVLDGPKSCILKHDRFVSVSSRMWIFPGRAFSFKVERSRNDLAMALDGEKGPSFTDDSPPREAARLRLRIVFDPEGKDDAIRLDDLEVRLAKE